MIVRLGNNKQILSPTDPLAIHPARFLLILEYVRHARDISCIERGLQVEVRDCFHQFAHLLMYRWKMGASDTNSISSEMVVRCGRPPVA